jgi:outer membrane lipoprotein
MNMPSHHSWLSALLFVVFLSSCSAIPSHIMKQVDPKLTFIDAKNAPGQYRGKVFLLGGTVSKKNDLQDMTVLRVREHPLDSLNVPHVSAPSEGEFQVVIRPPVDPSLYRRGQRVTVVGKLIGVEAGTDGRQTQSVLHFEALYLRRWSAPAPLYEQDFDPNYPDPYSCWACPY